MASAKQRAAARRNIKKAASAAKRKRTIAHLPKSTRTALGKQAARVRKEIGARVRVLYAAPLSLVCLAGRSSFLRVLILAMIARVVCSKTK